MSGEVDLANVNRVKGLEYRAVAIVGCDEDRSNEDDLQKLGDRADFDEFTRRLTVCCNDKAKIIYLYLAHPGSLFNRSWIK